MHVLEGKRKRTEKAIVTGESLARQEGEEQAITAHSWDHGIKLFTAMRCCEKVCDAKGKLITLGLSLALGGLSV